VKIAKQATVFAIIGIAATLCHTTIAASSVYMFNFNLIQANTIGYLLAVPISYFGHSLYSFNKAITIRTFIIFFSNNTVLFICTIITSFILEQTNINAYLGILITVILLPIISFIVHKFMTFKA